MPTQPEQHEVETPKVVQGKVRFMSNEAFNNPAPILMKRVLAASKYILTGAITLVSASDLFTGGQAKIINFSCAALILVLGGIEFATGVEPAPLKKIKGSKQ